MVWAFLLACAPEPEITKVEPLDLPADRSESGVPVGVQTIEWQGLSVEVWYPAADSTRGAPEQVDLLDWVPPSVLEQLDGLVLPLLATSAVRDAEVRFAEEPFPVVLFSHGLGGMRVQSVDLSTHLASRGYVVVATEHVGRSVGDLLPCLFQPPVEGCELSFDDPAIADLGLLIDWAESAADDGFLAGTFDMERIGVFGHSAGGDSTVTYGDIDERIDAIFPMSGREVVTRDLPVVFIAGECDGAVPAESTAAAAATSGAPYVEVAGAGHLAFSNLCDLDLTALAAPLVGRDDVNPIFLDMITTLGTDGCPPTPPIVEGCTTYADPDETARPIRQVLTAHFDIHLRGQEADLVEGWPALSLTP